MKLQKTTLGLMVLAALLAGGVYILERRSPQPPEASTPQARPIFSLKEDEIQAVTIRRPEQTLELVKTTAKGDRTPSWRLQSPVQAAASEASVAYLLNLLATGQSSSTVTVASDRLEEFGLDVPLARLEVKLANRRTHRLILGKPNFNQTALYAQTDPEMTPEQTVLLVPKEFENAVKRPLTEWQETPAPSASPANPSARPKTDATVRPDQR